MLRLGRRRRDVAAQALREMGNLALGAFVFGQFLVTTPLSIRLFLAGLATWLAFVISAILCTMEAKDD